MDDDQNRGDDSERRTRLAPAERREQILGVAGRRFRRDGYSAVSMEDVASDLGVARGLLHHYFGSKRELYLAVVERQIRVPDSVPLVPEGVSGDLDSVVATCVDLWLDLVEASGGIWSGATTGFVDSDVSTIFASARDALVERMLDEVPFPPADRVLMRSVLRCFAAMAAVATNEWLEDGQLTRAEVAELLTTSLVGLVQVSVPAMEQTRDTVIPG